MEPAQHPLLAQAVALSAAGRHAEAVALVRQLADQDHPEALVTLARFYWRGGPVVRDLRRARDLFRRASDAGEPIARRGYTNLLASGIAGPLDWPAAMDRLREEAREDTRRALMVELIAAMDLTHTGQPRAIPQARSLSESPEVALIPGLFTAAECDFLMLVAEPIYEISRVLDEQGRETLDPIRTSEGASIHWLIENPVIAALNRRLAVASGTHYAQGEPLLILRYRPGQQYRPHYDALPGVANQRFRTALVYLNHGYGGGETEFPKADLRVEGAQGDAIVFRNIGDDGRADPMSEHAGLPVTEGVKYLASRWIRQQRHVPGDE
jgi:prolyl 4-hydroxylase